VKQKHLETADLDQANLVCIWSWMTSKI